MKEGDGFIEGLQAAGGLQKIVERNFSATLDEGGEEGGSEQKEVIVYCLGCVFVFISATFTAADALPTFRGLTNLTASEANELEDFILGFNEANSTCFGLIFSSEDSLESKAQGTLLPLVPRLLPHLADDSLLLSHSSRAPPFAALLRHRPGIALSSVIMGRRGQGDHVGQALLPSRRTDRRRPRRRRLFIRSRGRPQSRYTQ